jgi:hypothetical protein
MWGGGGVGYELGVEFCEARLAGVVEDEDGVDHGGCLVGLEWGVGCHRILGLRVCLGLLVFCWYVRGGYVSNGNISAPTNPPSPSPLSIPPAQPSFPPPLLPTFSSAIFLSLTLNQNPSIAIVLKP